MNPQIKKIVVTELQQGLPAITPAFGTTLAEACAICLTDQGHSGSSVLNLLN